VGACLALARGADARAALRRGNTLPRSVCVHWVRDREVWLRRQRAQHARILAVELAEGATRSSLNVAVAGSLVAYRLAGML
jgi:hypothetical protein